MQRVHESQWGVVPITLPHAPMRGMWRGDRYGRQDVPESLNSEEYMPSHKRKSGISESHKLMYLQGIIYCGLCGKFTHSQSIRGLHGVCPGKPNSVCPGKLTNKSRLGKILRGEHPLKQQVPALPSINF